MVLSCEEQRQNPCQQLLWWTLPPSFAKGPEVITKVIIHPLCFLFHGPSLPPPSVFIIGQLLIGQSQLFFSPPTTCGTGKHYLLLTSCYAQQFTSGFMMHRYYTNSESIFWIIPACTFSQSVKPDYEVSFPCMPLAGPSDDLIHVPLTDALLESRLPQRVQEKQQTSSINFNFFALR